MMVRISEGTNLIHAQTRPVRSDVPKLTSCRTGEAWVGKSTDTGEVLRHSDARWAEHRNAVSGRFERGNHGERIRAWLNAMNF